MRLEGIDKVKTALRIRRGRYASGIERGLKTAGLFLLRESMKLVPVQTGALRASGPAVTRATGSGFRTVMTVGYGTDYAVFVHENLEAAHGAKFNVKHADRIAAATTPAQKAIWFERGPRQTAKFLEIPLNMYRSRLAQIVRQEASKP